MSGGTVAKRVGEIMRDGGPKALFWKALGEICYRRLHLFVDDFQTPLDPPPARIPLTYRLIDSNDFADYFSITPDADRSEFERRLSAGHECVSGWHEGQLVGYCWSGATRAPINYLGHDLLLEPGWVYGYEMLVAPAVRRQRVSIGVLGARRRILKELGHRYELTAVMPENTPAYGFQRIMGRKRAGTIRTFWAGPWKRTRTEAWDIEPYPNIRVAPMGGRT